MVQPSLTARKCNQMPACAAEAINGQAITKSEMHLVAAIGRTRLRLCIEADCARRVPTISIGLDGHSALRLAAAARLEMALKGKHARPDRTMAPSVALRRRLILALQINDAVGADASSREIAYRLVLPNHRELAGAQWKGSGERRHVLRLIANSRRLTAQGYRKLLLHS